MAGPLKNQKHEAFVIGVFEGKPASQAYLDAGYNCTNAAARMAASRLMTNDNVASRLAELQTAVSEKVVQSAVLNKEVIVSAVHRLATKAENLGQIANARSCWELLGREHGTFVERRIVTVRRLADLDMEELQELAAYGADGRRTARNAGQGSRGRAN